MSRKRKEKPALVANAADEEQVENAKREEAEQLADSDIAWRNVSATRDGQLVLSDVLTFCRMFASPFGADERYTTLAIGRADVGRFVLKRMELNNPQAFIAIMSQRAEEELQ